MCTYFWFFANWVPSLAFFTDGEVWEGERGGKGVCCDLEPFSCKFWTSPTKRRKWKDEVRTMDYLSQALWWLPLRSGLGSPNGAVAIIDSEKYHIFDMVTYRISHTCTHTGEYCISGNYDLHWYALNQFYPTLKQVGPSLVLYNHVSDYFHLYFIRLIDLWLELMKVGRKCLVSVLTIKMLVSEVQFGVQWKSPEKRVVWGW